ncbi:MAG: carbonic anhydrase [Aureliella sp.]|jgi:carbonic anhydrase
MERIIEGVKKFRSEEYPKNAEFFQSLAAKTQTPMALFITCADSRIHPNLITQTEPGDLFLLRNAGNIVPPHGSVVAGEAATIEYAIEVLNVRNIIICGHSQCGAMQALISNQRIDELPAVSEWFQHAEVTRRIVRQKYADLPPHEKAIAAVEQNVLVQLNNLSTHPSVAAGLATGQLHTYGWYYDIGTGCILQYDPEVGRFEELGHEAVATNSFPFRRARETA